MTLASHHIWAEKFASLSSMCDIQIGHFRYSQEDICHLGVFHSERRKTVHQKMISFQRTPSSICKCTAINTVPDYGLHTEMWGLLRGRVNKSTFGPRKNEHKLGRDKHRWQPPRGANRKHFRLSVRPRQSDEQEKKYSAPSGSDHSCSSKDPFVISVPAMCSGGNCGGKRLAQVLNNGVCQTERITALLWDWPLFISPVFVLLLQEMFKGMIHSKTEILPLKPLQTAQNKKTFLKKSYTTTGQWL